MKFSNIIINQGAGDNSAKTRAKKIRAIAHRLAKDFKCQNLSIIISFITAQQMRKLNLKYRKKNKETDVLSFNMDEHGILGDVLICPDYVKKMFPGKKQREEEFLRLAIHGIMHLIGFDHKRKADRLKMMRIQEQYVKGGLI